MPAPTRMLLHLLTAAMAQSGQHLLVLSITGFDPNATSVSPSCSVTKLVSNPIKALV